MLPFLWDPNQYVWTLFYACLVLSRSSGPYRAVTLCEMQLASGLGGPSYATFVQGKTAAVGFLTSYRSGFWSIIVYRCVSWRRIKSALPVFFCLQISCCRKYAWIAFLSLLWLSTTVLVLCFTEYFTGLESWFLSAHRISRNLGHPPGHLSWSSRPGRRKMSSFY